MNNNRTDVPEPQPGNLDTKRKPGAPKGNRNACVHSYYSKQADAACRRVIKSDGYDGLDLEIVLAMWQKMRLNGLAPGRQLLHDTALRRLFALMRKKYRVRVGDEESLITSFISLSFDLVLRPALQFRLAAAQDGNDSSKADG